MLKLLRALAASLKEIGPVLIVSAAGAHPVSIVPRTATRLQEKMAG